MRSRLRAVAVCLAVLGIGCGGGVSPGDPKQITGTYSVKITANNMTDTDTMYVSLGANNTVLLDFVYGISKVRCLVANTTMLSIISQPIHVEHSTGVIDGTAAGKGTIGTDGTVNIELDVTSGTGTGGTTDAGAGGKVSLAITGTKQ